MNEELIGEKLGSFRLEEILGSGAMGVVFRATHESTGRAAAVKVVSVEIAQKGKVYERFEREAEILKQFRHPNIVRWLAWGRYKGTSYIAMEFIQGATLERILQDRGGLSWREVVDLGIQICDAMHYAHERGVVHRDLKPSNLMITPEGQVKLTDFGIAKDLDRTALTATGRTLGTAAYMAPEQIRGTPAVSHKTDLYALGVVFYQMLTGKTPFDGGSPMVLMHYHLNEPPPRPSDKVEEIPRALDDLVIALMAKAPDQRPWDAAAVGQTLTELRDKAERNESIAMVWPTPGSKAANPPRAGSVSDARPRKKGRKTTAADSAKVSNRDSDTGWFRSVLLNRAALETSGLVLALIVIAGFIGYLVWPPSADYLYHHAEPLMASNRRADWLTARDEFINPLDERFPEHPYREQTRKWRDQIILDEAEGRAKILSSPAKTRFSDPNTNGERQYVSFDTLATKASNEGNEMLAVTYWNEMAKVLKPDDPDDRPWYLLALKRAEELETKIRDRRAFVEEQLRRSAVAFQAGRPNEALAIRTMLTEKYGHFTDLADLLGPPLEPESPTPPPRSPPSSQPPSSATPEAPSPRSSAASSETQEEPETGRAGSEDNQASSR